METANSTKTPADLDQRKLIQRTTLVKKRQLAYLRAMKRDVKMLKSIIAAKVKS